MPQLILGSGEKNLNKTKVTHQKCRRVDSLECLKVHQNAAQGIVNNQKDKPLLKLTLS